MFDWLFWFWGGGSDDTIIAKPQLHGRLKDNRAHGKLKDNRAHGRSKARRQG